MRYGVGVHPQRRLHLLPSTAFAAYSVLRTAQLRSKLLLGPHHLVEQRLVRALGDAETGFQLLYPVFVFLGVRRRRDARELVAAVCIERSWRRSAEVRYSGKRRKLGRKLERIPIADGSKM